MSLRLIPTAGDAATLASDSRELLAALAALHGRLISLAHLAAEKLCAMRAADVATLDELAAREAAELDLLQERDAARQAIVARMAQHLPDSDGRLPKLTELAARLPEPLASQIRAKNEGLRVAARRLEEKNRLVAVVARGLHAHVRGVFAELAGANQETVVYERTGRHDQRVTRSWVDAVG
jgi:hypothetical protein